MSESSSNAFLRRLRAELPVWVRQGWVAPEHQQSILDHVAQRAETSPRYLVLVLSIMGALLLGAGVISFFAANWGLIPKAVKLGLLFGALGAAYGAAAWCVARGQETLAHALALLAVLFFGANIFLIAQIYHIDAHFPNGVLLWALGALLTAAVLRSQPALVAALALALLWSGLETFVFHANPHGGFFLPWAVALGLAYRHRWLTALRVACVALLSWCVMLLCARDFLDRPWVDGEVVALLQLYVFTGIAIYIVARGMSWSARAAVFAPSLVTTGAVLTVVALFSLGFPDIQHFQTAQIAPALSVAWIGVTAGLLALVAVLMMWRYQGTPLKTLPHYRQGAFVWLVVASALALANLFAAGRYPGWIAIGYNLLGFAGVIWLVLTGVDRGERRLVNIGFAFFAALLLARYVDTFWALLERSYFFMVGGVLLLVAGYFLERSRRKLTVRIDQAGGAA